MKYRNRLLAYWLSYRRTLFSGNHSSTHFVHLNGPATNSLNQGPFQQGPHSCSPPFAPTPSFLSTHPLYPPPSFSPTQSTQLGWSMEWVGSRLAGRTQAIHTVCIHICAVWGGMGYIHRGRFPPSHPGHTTQCTHAVLSHPCPERGAGVFKLEGHFMGRGTNSITRATQIPHVGWGL